MSDGGYQVTQPIWIGYLGGETPPRLVAIGQAPAKSEIDDAPIEWPPGIDSPAAAGRLLWQEKWLVAGQTWRDLVDVRSCGRRLT